MLNCLISSVIRHSCSQLRLRAENLRAQIPLFCRSGEMFWAKFAAIKLLIPAPPCQTYFELLFAELLYAASFAIIFALRPSSKGIIWGAIAHCQLARVYIVTFNLMLWKLFCAWNVSFNYITHSGVVVRIKAPFFRLLLFRSEAPLQQSEKPLFPMRSQLATSSARKVQI